MIATCPSCNTRYKVADEKVSPGGTKFKCKKCKTAFTVYRDMGEQRSKEPERRAPAMKSCPHCGKPIPAQAVKCRWCREDVTGQAPQESEGGFEEQGAYVPDSEHQDPFAPQGGEGHDAFGMPGSPGPEHQDPFAPQGGGEFTSDNPFAEEETFEGIVTGGGPAPVAGAGMSFGGPITGKKVSPLLFALPFWFGFIVMVAGEVITKGGNRGMGSLITLTGEIFLIYASIYWLIALYRAWHVIPDAYARTTPGKAVGFLFIPLFNIYWIFVAIMGLADDARDFLNRAGVMEEKIGTGLSTAYPIMFIVAQMGSFAGMMVLIFINKIVGAAVYGTSALVGLITLIMQTVLIFQWAKFNAFVLDNPGQFARIHSGASRTTNKSLMFIIIGVLVGGVFVLGILAAILVPVLVASRGM